MQYDHQPIGYGNSCTERYGDRAINITALALGILPLIAGGVTMMAGYLQDDDFNSTWYVGVAIAGISTLVLCTTGCCGLGCRGGTTAAQALRSYGC